MTRILAVILALAVAPVASALAGPIGPFSSAPTTQAQEHVIQVQGRCGPGMRAVFTERGRFLRCEPRGGRQGGGGGGTVHTPYCYSIYSQCAARYGQGTYPYQRCAISRGCT